MLLGLCWLLISWLLGSFPTGVVLASVMADVDIRGQGSGNIGATNMNRVLGRGFGLATLAVDLLKGLIAVLMVSYVWPEAPAFWPALAGLLAFVGHCWSPLLDFRGGKGVATGAGVMLALAPQPTLLAGAAWIVVAALTRRSSVAALVAVGLLPLATLWLAPAHLLVTVILGAGIVLRHRDNLARLRAGTER